jgi:hypothetical protein
MQRWDKRAREARMYDGELVQTAAKSDRVNLVYWM